MDAREFDHVVSKFGFTVENTDHKLAWLEVDGRKVVRTKRSHGRGDVVWVDAVAKQLKLTKPQLGEAVRCTLDIGGYIEILKAQNIISQGEAKGPTKADSAPQGQPQRQQKRKKKK